MRAPYPEAPDHMYEHDPEHRCRPVEIKLLWGGLEAVNMEYTMVDASYFGQFQVISEKKQGFFFFA